MTELPSAETPNYLLVCRLCGDGDLVMPFASPAARGKWAADHTRGTGHDKWWVADNPEQMARILAEQRRATTSPDIYVKCPLHEGLHGRVPDPSHPAGHTFTIDQAATLLWCMSADDWEDGPRCLLDVLKTEDQA